MSWFGTLVNKHSLAATALVTSLIVTGLLPAAPAIATNGQPSPSDEASSAVESAQSGETTSPDLGLAIDTLNKSVLPAVTGAVAGTDEGSQSDSSKEAADESESQAQSWCPSVPWEANPLGFTGQGEYAGNQVEVYAAGDAQFDTDPGDVVVFVKGDLTVGDDETYLDSVDPSDAPYATFDSELGALNAALEALQKQPSGKVSLDGETFTLTGDGQSPVQVFNISAEQAPALANADTVLNLTSIPGEVGDLQSTVILNVEGSDVTTLHQNLQLNINGLGVDADEDQDKWANLTQHLMWRFPQADAVLIGDQTDMDDEADYNFAGTIYAAKEGTDLTVNTPTNGRLLSNGDLDMTAAIPEAGLAAAPLILPDVSACEVKAPVAGNLPAPPAEGDNRAANQITISTYISNQRVNPASGATGPVVAQSGFRGWKGFKYNGGGVQCGQSAQGPLAVTTNPQGPSLTGLCDVWMQKTGGTHTWDLNWNQGGSEVQFRPYLDWGTLNHQANLYSLGFRQVVCEGPAGQSFKEDNLSLTWGVYSPSSGWAQGQEKDTPMLTLQKGQSADCKFYIDKTGRFDVRKEVYLDGVLTKVDQDFTVDMEVWDRDNGPKIATPRFEVPGNGEAVKELAGDPSATNDKGKAGMPFPAGAKAQFTEKDYPQTITHNGETYTYDRTAYVNRDVTIPYSYDYNDGFHDAPKTIIKNYYKKKNGNFQLKKEIDGVASNDLSNFNHLEFKVKATVYDKDNQSKVIGTEEFTLTPSTGWKLSKDYPVGSKVVLEELTHPTWGEYEWSSVTFSEGNTSLTNGVFYITYDKEDRNPGHSITVTNRYKHERPIWVAKEVFCGDCTPSELQALKNSSFEINAKLRCTTETVKPPDAMVRINEDVNVAGDGVARSTNKVWVNDEGYGECTASAAETAWPTPPAGIVLDRTENPNSQKASQNSEDNPLVVKNYYKKVIPQLTVCKDVENVPSSVVGDRRFDINVSLSGSSKNLQLNDNDCESFDVPMGTQVQISEGSVPDIPNYVFKGKTITYGRWGSGGKAESFTMTENTRVFVTNTYEEQRKTASRVRITKQWQVSGDITSLNGTHSDSVAKGKGFSADLNLWGDGKSKTSASFGQWYDLQQLNGGQPFYVDSTLWIEETNVSLPPGCVLKDMRMDSTPKLPAYGAWWNGEHTWNEFVEGDNEFAATNIVECSSACPYTGFEVTSTPTDNTVTADGTSSYTVTATVGGAGGNAQVKLTPTDSRLRVDGGTDPVTKSVDSSGQVTWTLTSTVSGLALGYKVEVVGGKDGYDKCGYSTSRTAKFVAVPTEPGSATIQVVKYTCDEGKCTTSQGTLADWQVGYADATNVTPAASSGTKGTGTNGSGASWSVTLTDKTKQGTFKVYENAQTGFQFDSMQCAVGTGAAQGYTLSQSVPLEDGQTTKCTLFNKKTVTPQATTVQYDTRWVVAGNHKTFTPGDYSNAALLAKGWPSQTIDPRYSTNGSTYEWWPNDKTAPGTWGAVKEMTAGSGVWFGANTQNTGTKSRDPLPKGCLWNPVSGGKAHKLVRVQSGQEQFLYNFTPGTTPEKQTVNQGTNQFVLVNYVTCEEDEPTEDTATITVTKEVYDNTAGTGTAVKESGWKLKVAAADWIYADVGTEVKDNNSNGQASWTAQFGALGMMSGAELTISEVMTPAQSSQYELFAGSCKVNGASSGSFSNGAVKVTANPGDKVECTLKNGKKSTQPETGTAKITFEKYAKPWGGSYALANGWDLGVTSQTTDVEVVEQPYGAQTTSTIGGKNGQTVWNVKYPTSNKEGVFYLYETGKSGWSLASAQCKQGSTTLPKVTSGNFYRFTVPDLSKGDVTCEFRNEQANPGSGDTAEVNIYKTVNDEELQSGWSVKADSVDENATLAKKSQGTDDSGGFLKTEAYANWTVTFNSGQNSTKLRLTEKQKDGYQFAGGDCTIYRASGNVDFTIPAKTFESEKGEDWFEVPNPIQKGDDLTCTFRNVDAPKQYDVKVTKKWVDQGGDELTNYANKNATVEVTGGKFKNLNEAFKVEDGTTVTVKETGYDVPEGYEFVGLTIDGEPKNLYDMYSTKVTGNKIIEVVNTVKLKDAGTASMKVTKDWVVSGKGLIVDGTHYGPGTYGHDTAVGKALGSKAMYYTLPENGDWQYANWGSTFSIPLTGVEQTVWTEAGIGDNLTNLKCSWNAVGDGMITSKVTMGGKSADFSMAGGSYTAKLGVPSATGTNVVAFTNNITCDTPVPSCPATALNVTVSPTNGSIEAGSGKTYTVTATVSGGSSSDIPKLKFTATSVDLQLVGDATKTGRTVTWQVKSNKANTDLGYKVDIVAEGDWEPCALSKTGTVRFKEPGVVTASSTITLVKEGYPLSANGSARYPEWQLGVAKGDSGDWTLQDAGLKDANAGGTLQTTTRKTAEWTLTAPKDGKVEVKLWEATSTKFPDLKFDKLDCKIDGASTAVPVQGKNGNAPTSEANAATITVTAGKHTTCWFHNREPDPSKLRVTPTKFWEIDGTLKIGGETYTDTTVSVADLPADSPFNNKFLFKPQPDPAVPSTEEIAWGTTQAYERGVNDANFKNGFALTETKVTDKELAKYGCKWQQKKYPEKPGGTAAKTSQFELKGANYVRGFSGNTASWYYATDKKYLNTDHLEFKVTNAIECTPPEEATLTLEKKVVNPQGMLGSSYLKPSDWKLIAGGDPQIVPPTEGKEPVPATETLGPENPSISTTCTTSSGKCTSAKTNPMGPAVQGGEYDLGEASSTAKADRYSPSDWACDGLVGAPGGRLWFPKEEKYKNFNCAITNSVAEMTLLKAVEGGDGKVKPSDFKLMASGTDAKGKLVTEYVTGSETASASNSFLVTPGKKYELSESGKADGYKLDRIEKYDSTVSGCALSAGAGPKADEECWKTQTLNGDKLTNVQLGAGERGIYRFVNKKSADATLTLEKKVVNPNGILTNEYTKPGDWTLTAEVGVPKPGDPQLPKEMEPGDLVGADKPTIGGADCSATQGTCTSAKTEAWEVLTGIRYQLREGFNGHESGLLYQQGTWSCTVDQGSGQPPIALPGADSPLITDEHRDVLCTITNSTAEVTLLKKVEGGDAEPSDFKIGVSGTGITKDKKVAGSAAATADGSFLVKPGDLYTLSEEQADGYELDRVELYQVGPNCPALKAGDTPEDSEDCWKTVTENFDADKAELSKVKLEGGEWRIYRFVNKHTFNPTGPTLPHAGGMSTTIFLVVAGISLTGAVVFGPFSKRRQGRHAQ